MRQNDSSKNLPIDIYRAYVNAHMLVRDLTPSTSLAFAKMRNLSLESELPSLVWDALSPYINVLKNKDHSPISYEISSYFFIGLVERVQKIDLIQEYTYQIGEYWWWGEPPVSYYSVLYPGLIDIIGRPVEQRLLDFNKKDLQSIEEVSCHIKALRDFSIKAVVQEFYKKTDIPYRLLQKKKQYIIEIIECPCCCFLTDGCEFFMGLFAGILKWLQGTYHFQRSHTKMILNEADSTGHNIVINIV